MRTAILTMTVVALALASAGPVSGAHPYPYGPGSPPDPQGPDYCAGGFDNYPPSEEGDSGRFECTGAVWTDCVGNLDNACMVCQTYTYSYGHKKEEGGNRTVPDDRRTYENCVTAP